MTITSVLFRPAVAAGLGVLLVSASPSPGHAADYLKDLNDALVGGKFRLNARYRFEYVDQDGFEKDARASTLRTRFGYETGTFMNVLLYAEVENIVAVGNDLYNSTVNGRTRFPLVADPEETELNQAYIQFTGIPDTRLKVGRQRITFDNHRFIGNVKFRQNEQTYDSVRLTNSSLPDTTLDYVFINKVHRIFGDVSPAGNHPIEAHLFRGQYKGFDLGTLIAYAWVLDYDRAAQFGLSSATFGGRFKGAYPVTEKVKLLYTAEYAHQVDNADNPADFSLSYFLGEAGASYMGVTGKVGYELLDGDGTSAFQTPLATGHAFQGWADQFLTTPATGVEDLYFSLGANYKGVKGKVVYHEFNAEEGSADLAHELDAIVKKTFFDHYTVELKYANFQSDGFGADIEKIWISFIVNY